MDKFPTRKPNRLTEYDYSTAGYYYVTICTYNRKELFGRICDNKMELDNAGEMVNSILHNLPQYVTAMFIDQGVIMPNHIHAIIIINHVGADLCVGPLQNDKLLNNGQAYPDGHRQEPVPTDKLSLSDIIHRFKTITTKKYIDGVKNDNWKPFNKHLWQRSFHDHIIRNDRSLNNIREYMVNNPSTWAEDNENIKTQIPPGGPRSVGAANFYVSKQEAKL